MPKWSISGLLSLCCLCLAGKLPAANTYAFFVSASATQVSVGDRVFYTILVTNIGGGTDIIVTNTFPTFTALAAATNSQGSFGTNANSVIFTNHFGIIGDLPFVTNTVVVLATAVGTNSNFVIVSRTSDVSESTNVTLIATAAPQAVLQGVIRPDSGQVFVNDRLHYSITFSNVGGAASQNVTISNFFSTNVIFRSASPNNVAFSDATHLILTAGSLAPGAVTSFGIIIQPTNAGPLTVTATFTGSNQDTNSIKSGSFMETILQPDTNQLIATIASPQTFDPQTGLMRQTILLSNRTDMGTGTVSSARVIVSGISYRLYNAVGTNGNDPFVIYSGSLAVGQAVSLLLEYFIPSRTPQPDPQLTAYPIAPLDLSAPPGAPPEPRIVDLGGGRCLIEFNSEPGRSYLIIYSDNSSFTNALKAQPTIVAPANRVQWIDEGPPKTVSPLTNVTCRFYRVIAQ